MSWFAIGDLRRREEFAWWRVCGAAGWGQFVAAEARGARRGVTGLHEG